jgi:hypothetical protein
VTNGIAGILIVAKTLIWIMRGRFAPGIMRTP